MAMEGAGRKQINLYLAEFRPVRIFLPAQSLLLGVAVFAAGLLLLYAWGSWSLRAYRQEADQVTAQAERIEHQLAQAAGQPRQADPQVVTEAEALEARTLALGQAQAAIAGGALGSEVGYAAQFLALSRATVPGAWLTRVEISGNGREMNLAGGALKGEDPARLIAALGSQTLFTGLSYAGLDVRPAEPPPREKGQEKAPPAQPSYLEFSLSARLAPKDGADAVPKTLAAGGKP